MNNLPLILSFLAHFLLGLYFVFYGVWNIYHWVPILKVMLKDGIPHPYLLLPLGIGLQVMLGTMIMFAFHVQFAAILLIPCLILTELIFHPFWRHHGDLRLLNFSIFITNMTAVIGGLLLLLSAS